MHIYIGTYQHVAAIDLKTGAEVWRTELPKGHYFVAVLEVDGRVIAGSGGYVYALDAQTGKILWTNELQGLRLGTVALAAAGRSVQWSPEGKSAVPTST